MTASKEVPSAVTTLPHIQLAEKINALWQHPALQPAPLGAEPNERAFAPRNFVVPRLWLLPNTESAAGSPQELSASHLKVTTDAGGSRYVQIAEHPQPYTPGTDWGAVVLRYVMRENDVQQPWAAISLVSAKSRSGVMLPGPASRHTPPLITYMEKPTPETPPPRDFEQLGGILLRLADSTLALADPAPTTY